MSADTPSPDLADHQRRPRPARPATRDQRARALNLCSSDLARAISSTSRSPITSPTRGNLPIALDHLRRDAPFLDVGRTPSTRTGLLPVRGVIPPGGRRDGTPAATPRREPPAGPGALPSRRPARPARAWALRPESGRAVPGGVTRCRLVPAELGVRVALSPGVVRGRRESAPGLLRLTRPL